MTGKWKNLVLATAMFNLGFVIWFSFAPFTGAIAEEFALSVEDLGIVASAAIVAVPLGRIVVGPLTDRYGAPVVACVTMCTVGVFAVVSAFAWSYEVFIASRIVASLAGVTFVIGIQHVSEWFEADELGTAEGIYAGIGNAGAGIGAYFTLPRVFDENWSGPIFASNWRATFFYTGVLAVVVGVVYLRFAEPARSAEKRAATRENAGFDGFLFVATRYGAIVLSAAYVMTFGLELAMNGWLGTYYREAFDEGDLVIAATFAATFSIAAGLLRPIGGYVSDLVARRELTLLPVFGGRYREQWTFLTLVFVVVSMVGMTLAGLTGEIRLAVVAAFLVGTACAFSEGAIFAQVPAMFPDSSGSVAGVVGGVGTVGGVVYPLVFAAPFLPNLHVGYAVTAFTMVPILVATAWAFRPEIAAHANERGVLVGGDRNPAVPADDD